MEWCEGQLRAAVVVAALRFFSLFKNIALAQVGTLAMLREESDAEGSCVGSKLCALQVFLLFVFSFFLKSRSRCKVQLCWKQSVCAAGTLSLLALLVQKVLCLCRRAAVMA